MVLVEVTGATKARRATLKLAQGRNFYVSTQGITRIARGCVGLTTVRLCSVDLDDPAFFNRQRQPAVFER